ncbi:hypothetical protein FGADI_2434 [Fusarium gaditjirri]|uniref:Uncharacterized protein n=1 Tax=Fusarium gaditjirri TaxID=282569 RepID=A0A8H4TI25_9HYPO|nr:hypothetical protein FGADI_2434 [Fusarium gaditjirri]
MDTEPNPSNESEWSEYLKSDLFWVFAIGIIANLAFANNEISPTKDNKEIDTDSSESSTFPEQKSFPLSMCYQQLSNAVGGSNQHREHSSPLSFEHRITSRFRQYLALLLCASPLSIQLIHGWLVLKTMWRMSFSLVKSTYPDSLRPYLLGLIIYSPAVCLMLWVWLMVVGVEVFIVMAQVTLCVKVWNLKPNEEPALPLACEEEV